MNVVLVESDSVAMRAYRGRTVEVDTVESHLFFAVVHGHEVVAVEPD